MLGEVVAIGRVERDGGETEPGEFFDPALESVLAIDERWEPALAGLSDYSHLSGSIAPNVLPSRPIPVQPKGGKSCLRSDSLLLALPVAQIRSVSRSSASSHRKAAVCE